METDRGEYGYREIGPEGSKGRPNPPREKKPFLEDGRPVYAVPGKEPSVKSAPSSDSKINLNVIIFISVLVLAIVGSYLLQSGKISLSSGSSSSAVAVDKIALKTEMVRTLNILNQMETKYAGQTEQLEKIGKLKAETRAILDSIK